MDMEKPHVLGILGGLGPMAGAYFYELLITHTKADSDQEHIDTVLSGRASTPDRTAFICGRSDQNPLDQMLADAKRLVAYGADILAMPCNTAHYFYDSLSRSLPVPLINIVEVTVKRAREQGCTKVGIMATEGTVTTGTYQKYCDAVGLSWEVPSREGQDRLNKIIYDEIKPGKEPDMESFNQVARELTERGCQRIILGCTELSLLRRQRDLGPLYIDSLETLAFEAIKACGKEIRY
ncbi:MAG: amino acid racemase [Clostridiales bacterium]|nr:amino acid racemase [Clostridiales bacterium]